MQNFMKISSVRAKLFRADREVDERMARQTGKYDEANRRFSQTCECTQKLMYQFYMYIWHIFSSSVIVFKLLHK
jgi:hypothetical protein